MFFDYVFWIDDIAVFEYGWFIGDWNFVMQMVGKEIIELAEAFVVFCQTDEPHPLPLSPREGIAEFYADNGFDAVARCEADEI